jgi:hypothetical protein
MSFVDVMGLLLLIAAVLAFIYWTARLPHHIHPRPTAIRFRFVRPGARRPWWRHLRRILMNLDNLPVGGTAPGTLAILDQNGNEIAGATFDAQPTLTSDDETIVTVAAGSTFADLNVTGVAEGATVIRANGSSGGVSLREGVAAVHVTAVGGGGAFAIDIRF